MDALASTGPAKLPKVPEGQFAELEKELALGPAEHGWEDQRWTLARVRALIAWKFGIDCSSAAVWRLLHRHGWSWQSPARHAGTRRAGSGFVEERRVAAGGMTAAALGAYIVFEDEAGFSMTPPRARTWGRRGQTPAVRVRGRSWRRWSIAAMCCYRPGESSRLIYRPRRHRKHRGKGRDAFACSDYRDLVVRAHRDPSLAALPAQILQAFKPRAVEAVRPATHRLLTAPHLAGDLRDQPAVPAQLDHPAPLHENLRRLPGSRQTVNHRLLALVTSRPCPQHHAPAPAPEHPRPPRYQQLYPPKAESSTRFPCIGPSSGTRSRCG